LQHIDTLQSKHAGTFKGGVKHEGWGW